MGGAVGTSRTLAHTVLCTYTRALVRFHPARLTGSSLALVALVACAFPAHAAKVACVGDSITFGYGLGNPSTESYPAQLAERLGAAHTVQNFGVSGATLLKQGDKPYWNESAYAASGAFDADVVVVMLGTNDAKPQNWSRKAEFAPNYAELIEHYRALGALVYVATPPPVYPPGAFDIPPDVVANEVVSLVRSIATDENAPLVDVFTALSGKAGDFPDTVHPNAAGAGLIADAVKAALDEHGLGGASGAAGAGGAGQAGRSNGGAAAFGGASSGTSPGGAGGRGGAPNTGGAGAGGGLAGATNGGSANGGGSVNGGSVNGGSVNGGAPTAGGNPGVGGQGSLPAGSSGTMGGNTGSAGTAATSGGTTTGRAGTANAGEPGAPARDAGDSDGCGCRTGESHAPVGGALALGGLAFALVVRRRRSTQCTNFDSRRM